MGEATESDIKFAGHMSKACDFEHLSEDTIYAYMTLHTALHVPRT